MSYKQELVIHVVSIDRSRVGHGPITHAREEERETFARLNGVAVLHGEDGDCAHKCEVEGIPITVTLGHEIVSRFQSGTNVPLLKMTLEVIE